MRFLHSYPTTPASSMSTKWSLLKHRFSALCLVLGLFFVTTPMLTAQVPPDTIEVIKVKKPVHAALRVTSEVGFATLFGTLAASPALISGVAIEPWNLKPYMISAAILYPAGVACGSILGGYITDSKSNYWAPFVGAYVGAAFADVTAYFLSNDYPVFSALLVLILPIVTSTIASEYSHYVNNRGKAASNSLNSRRMPISFGFSF